MEKDFEIIPHTADIKIRVYGKTLEKFFANALIGMFQAIGPRVEENSQCVRIGDRLVCKNLPIEHKIELEAIDAEVLLVNFLSEALYLSDLNNQAYLDAKINIIQDFKLKDGRNGVAIVAKIYGIEVAGFEIVEIKAVTYNDLKLENIDGIWQTDIVFDI